MGFLRTILIILLVYYMFKLFAKWFGPKIFAYAARRTEKHFKERFNEGEIRIDKKTVQKKKKDSEQIGEFIDFEEIE